MSLSALACNPGLCSVEFQVLCAKICGFKLLLPELQRESFGKRMEFCSTDSPSRRYPLIRSLVP